MVELFGAIGAKWKELGGPNSFLGQPFHQETPTGDGVGRFVRFPGGVIFFHPDTGAHEVHGLILERWTAMGHETSFLGYPVTDELPFSEGGRASFFQRGAIYFWADTGAIDIGEIFVHYTGLNCFGTTSGAGADEPYAVISVSVGGSETASMRTQIHSVNGGDSRPEVLELHRGHAVGVSIFYTLLEHDHGNPEDYVGAMRGLAGAASAGVTALVKLIPKVGPVLAAASAPVLGLLNPIIAAAAMALSSLSVIVNSALLKRVKFSNS